jgi:hypothetical protein
MRFVDPSGYTSVVVITSQSDISKFLSFLGQNWYDMNAIMSYIYENNIGTIVGRGGYNDDNLAIQFFGGAINNNPVQWFGFDIFISGKLSYTQYSDGTFNFWHHFPQLGEQVLPPLDGFWEKTIDFLSGGRSYEGFPIGNDGRISGIPLNIGTPSFVGGPLRKGQKAISIGKHLFNPTALHSVKKGVLAFVNPKNFSHIVGDNPDLMFKGGKIWLTGTKTGGYFGKSYETGLTMSDFLRLF